MHEVCCDAERNSARAGKTHVEHRVLAEWSALVFEGKCRDLLGETKEEDGGVE